MVILDKFKLKDIVSFETYVGAILPNDYDHVKVMGVIPAEDCHRYGFDAYATHAQIYPLLPSGIAEDDPESYDYLRLQTQTGEQRIVGIPWINTSTIKIYKQTNASFKVMNVAQEDIERIMLAISRHGYSCSVTLD